jgi:anthranilate phosphoribosyltransferase
MLVGVADPQRMNTMAHALATRTTSSWVVHGHGGLDELSLAGPNRVIATVDGLVQPETMVDAQTISIERASNDELRGGDPTHNARIVRGLLNGEIRGAVRDVVVFNAAAALVVAGAARDLAAGAILANAAIDGGTARATLDAYIAATVS